MYFMSGDGKTLVNTDYVERFLVAEKADASLVIASYGERQPVTLARYRTIDEAMDALTDLLRAISEDAKLYQMSASTGAYIPPFQAKERYHGRKTKGHGGS